MRPPFTQGSRSRSAIMTGQAMMASRARMGGTLTLRILLVFHLGILMTLAASPLRAADAPASSQRIEQGGVAVVFEHETSELGTGFARLSLSDARTGRAIEGARPAAWMLARRSEQVAAESSCEDKAALLSGGSLGQRADIDLNSYRLLTLNHDHTVAFINPHLRLRGTQLESIIALPGAGHDWVIAHDARRLAVSLRDADAVALIDLPSRRLMTTVPTGAGSRPTRLLADPDGRRLWIGLDGGNEVLALDLDDGRVLGRARVGQGLHTLAVSPSGPWLFVTNAGSNDLSRIDRSSLQAAPPIPLPATPVAAAWSEAARGLVVVSANAGQVSLVDGDAGRVEARIPLARGVLSLGLFDEGRYALVLNGREQTLSLVDLARARVAAERSIDGGPDQIAFTRDFAYVRTGRSAEVQLISLAAARDGRLEGPRIAMGQRSTDDAPEAFNVAGVMAAAPEGNGMLVANPGDASVYRYVQGMMVPVNSHSNHRRQARGLLVLDSSLTERTPGHFEAAIHVPRPARYDVVVRNLRPAVTACFTVALEGPPAGALPDRPAPPRPRLTAARSAGPDALRLDFTLAGAAPGARVNLLLVQHHGQWQARAQARALGDGRYDVRLQGLPAGEFDAMIEAPALDLAYTEGRMGRIHWPLTDGERP